MLSEQFDPPILIFLIEDLRHWWLRGASVTTGTAQLAMARIYNSAMKLAAELTPASPLRQTS